MQHKIIQSGDYTDAFNANVYDLVPEGSVCLDVGCWNGNLGKALITKKDCIVDGIDVKKDVLALAKKSGYRTTQTINLNNDTYNLTDLPGKYDVIICADVLEHLIDPARVLTELKRYLKSDGILIISLPNVAFALNRLLLMLGKWDYTEFGTLDKTHLRFYTVDSVSRMVSGAGYIIRSVRPYNQFGLLRFIQPLTSLFPRFFAYQIMIIAGK